LELRAFDPPELPPYLGVVGASSDLGGQSVKVSQILPKETPVVPEPRLCSAKLPVVISQRPRVLIAPIRQGVYETDGDVKRSSRIKTFRVTCLRIARELPYLILTVSEGLYQSAGLTGDLPSHHPSLRPK
jgi:hypothetical protein